MVLVSCLRSLLIRLSRKWLRSLFVIGVAQTDHFTNFQRPCAPHGIRNQLSMCQSLLCADLVSRYDLWLRLGRYLIALDALVFWAPCWLSQLALQGGRRLRTPLGFYSLTARRGNRTRPRLHQRATGSSLHSDSPGGGGYARC